MFSNGNVRRAWSWYQRKHPKRRDSSDGVDSLGKANTQSSDYPKSLQDLIDMREAGAETRWRDSEINTSDSISSTPADESTFYGFESDGSSDSGDDSHDLTPPTPAKPNIDTYFSDQSLMGQHTNLLFTSKNTDEIAELFTAADQEDVSPIVYVATLSNGDVLGNDQNEALASKLDFGEIPEDRAKLSVRFQDRWEQIGSPSKQSKYGERIERYERSAPTIPGLPRYRSLLPSTAANQVDLAETGVHGGEYAVRPNAEDSAMFYRKLVDASLYSE